MESSGKILDELPEVDTLVSDIVEYCLVAVALEFHITNLHVEAESLGYLPALNHRGVLTGLSLTVFVHVHRLGLTVYALDVVSTLEIGLPNLQQDKPSRERHHTDVMTGIGLHSHIITFRQRQMIDVMIVSFARILELNLHKVSAFRVARHVSKPVVSVELMVLTATSAAAQPTVASVPEFIIHIIVVHKALS